MDYLVAQGWGVEAEGQLIRRPGAMQLSVTSNVDWFELSAKIDFDGVSAPLPALLALRNGEKYVQLDDGTKGMLPEQWLAKYGQLAELGESEAKDDIIRFAPLQAMLLDALLAAQEQDTVTVDRRFAAYREKLRSFSGIAPANAPKTFKGELRHYQEEGLGWLHFLRDFGFGGCLADDMGLGKDGASFGTAGRSPHAESSGRRVAFAIAGGGAAEFGFQLVRGSPTFFAKSTTVGLQQR